MQLATCHGSVDIQRYVNRLSNTVPNSLIPNIPVANVSKVVYSDNVTFFQLTIHLKLN